MSLALRIVLIIAALVAFVWVCYKIRKSKIKMGHSIFWIVFSFVILIIAIFPQIASWLSELLGFAAPVNFVFFIVLCAILFKLFTLSIEMSQQSYKISLLSQEIGIRDNDLKTRIKDLESRSDFQIAISDLQNTENLDE